MSLKKPALGADLVIPLLALGFAIYFFYSIAGLSWEAAANGIIIGTALVVLIAAQLARIGYNLARGRGSFSFEPLWRPREVLGKRIGMVLVTIVFIATLPWLGLTLGLFAGMAAALWVMGVRRPGVIVAISGSVAAACYILFIATLQSEFPHGPVEQLLSNAFK